MRSRGRRAPHVARVAMLLIVLASPVAHAQPSATSRNEPAAAPTALEIQRAVDALEADANLSGQRTIKSLRWKAPSTPAPVSSPGWLTWFRGLTRWLDQSARYVVWVTVAIAAVLLGMYLTRVLGGRIVTPRTDAFVAPTHVGDLDIHPDTLPADIGAAARTLWDRGRQRAALALLYRGMLSRLAHEHRVPIRDSTTEGDCLRLAAAHLRGPRREYVTRLVQVWQRAVYGYHVTEGPTVYRLCDEFTVTLDRPPTPDASGGSS